MPKLAGPLKPSGPASYVSMKTRAHPTRPCPGEKQDQDKASQIFKS